MDFYKYQGTGNDFVVIDNMDLQRTERSALAARVCDRRFGVGADSFIAVEPSSVAAVKMAFFNADGSPAEMCGNGIRCFAKFVRDTGIVSEDRFTVETGDGVKVVELLQNGAEESIVRVNMGDLGAFSRFSVPVAGAARDGEETVAFDVMFTWLGVPHAVIACEEKGASMETLNQLALRYGDALEHAEAFGEAHTNVDFIKVIQPDHILSSTWERGAGKTLACGTGACSSAAAAREYLGCGDSIRVTMPGGEVTVTFIGSEVYMEGSAVLTFVGSVPNL